MLSLYTYFNNSLVFNLIGLIIIYFLINLSSLKTKPTKLFINYTQSVNTQYHTNTSQYKYLLGTFNKVFSFLLLLLILDTNNSLWMSNFNNGFLMTDHIFYFCNFLLFFSFLSLNLLIKFLYKNHNTSIEIIFVLFIFVLSNFFYFFVNNIIYIFFLLELQGLIFIYLLSVFFFSSNLLQPKLIFNLFLLQFWLTFFSSLLFLLLILWTQNIFTTLDLYDINMESLFLSHSYLVVFSTLFLIIFLFKLGIFPFYLWKLDLFKLLPSMAVFCYNVFYTTTLLLLLINYSYLLQNIWPYLNWLMEIYIILVLVIVPMFFYFITEIRSFFLISANLQINLILLILFNTTDTIRCLSIFNSLSYIYLLILSSIILLILSQIKIWFLTDLQFIKNTFIWNLLICFLLSAAGIPPFWGFFCKLSVISYYFINYNFLIAVLMLISGYCGGYFYWQFIRFYSLKSSYMYLNISFLNVELLMLTTSLVLILINIFSIWFLYDLFIFSSFFL
jgi:NADH:ubiquinone oxidoreductase subunit 2 (subunit N)